jgi:hypothetical protein
MGILADASRGSVWQCCELSLLVATIRSSVGCSACGPSEHSSPHRSERGNLNSAEAERCEAIVREARSRSDVCAQVRTGPPCGP